MRLCTKRQLFSSIQSEVMVCRKKEQFLSKPALFDDTMELFRMTAVYKMSFSNYQFCFLTKSSIKTSRVFISKSAKTIMWYMLE